MIQNTIQSYVHAAIALLLKIHKKGKENTNKKHKHSKIKHRYSRGWMSELSIDSNQWESYTVWL